MTTKEVAEICGVTDVCIRQNAKKVGIDVGDRWNPHDWTEEELKRIQIQLMANVTNRGAAATSVGIVEDITKSRFCDGLAVKVLSDSGDVEAMKEYCEMLIQKTQAQHDLLLEQQKNQLLIEQKEAAEAETARIFQYNKNFHSNLYTATDLAKMLGTTANKIGRIANEQGLKQEPLYGKLGKIQLNNGRWCDIFYYNDDAKTVIENNL